MIDYYRQRAVEYDQWWERAGRYDQGAELNQRWTGDREQVYSAFDAINFRGHVLELAPGTGTWTQRLVRAADAITAVDSSPEMIEVNRGKLASEKVRYIVADLFNWQPDQKYDGIVFGFWLSHVPVERLDSFFQFVASALRPGGKIFFIDGLRERTSTAIDHSLPDDSQQLMTRKLNDGRTFRIVKNFYLQGHLNAACKRAGLSVEIKSTPTYFYYGIGSVI